jgi:hypothetical protein
MAAVFRSLEVPMSKVSRMLLVNLAIVAVIPVIVWPIYWAVLHDNPMFAYKFNAMLGITIACLLPFTLVAAGIAFKRLYETLRAPDIVIRVTQQPTPLMARFLEQDRRLEKREQLKRQLFDLNGEIETFNANLSPDDRKAWQHRPGPYGK